MPSPPTTASAPKQSRWGRIVLVVVACIVCVLGACVGYPLVRIKTAQSRVRTWCAAAPSEGQPADPTRLASDATARGLQVIGPTAGADGTIAVLAYDSFVFARWFCDMKVRAGVVREKRVSFLD